MPLIHSDITEIEADAFLADFQPNFTLSLDFSADVSTEVVAEELCFFFAGLHVFVSEDPFEPFVPDQRTYIPVIFDSSSDRPKVTLFAALPETLFARGLVREAVKIWNTIGRHHRIKVSVGGRGHFKRFIRTLSRELSFILFELVPFAPEELERLLAASESDRKSVEP